MTHPPGMIVTPVADNLRYPEFFVDFQMLDVPVGSRVSIHRNGSVVQNMNASLLDLEDEHEWVFLLGDDHCFPKDLLTQLLDHDVDVVVPLCVKRTPPFQLVIYKEESYLFDERLEKEYPGFLPYLPSEVPDELFTCVAAGGAGMLIRRRVLDKIGYPWFESSDGVYINEDLVFCQKVRDAGFEIHCDPRAYLGHIGNMHIWPAHHEGRLMIKIDCGGKDGENEVFIGESAAAYA